MSTMQLHGAVVAVRTLLLQRFNPALRVQSMQICALIGLYITKRVHSLGYTPHGFGYLVPEDKVLQFEVFGLVDVQCHGLLGVLQCGRLSPVCLVCEWAW